ncbi:glycosyltransferase family 2 protein [Roseivirga sp. BDSF3-8]|uniref:glycosyltransferase family 2 protein n=1 Tax=Roseivirga sp. BDSF3-8 TaxID=3241598 RepID=UPI0035327A40
MTNEPLVSIIMPVYNGELYVKEAIQSVLSQAYRQWELIIINDGSTDRSEEVILSFDDSRIVYHRQENAGVAKARNKALGLMKGTLFCFLDADDILPGQSLLVRVRIFRENPEVNFVDGTVLQKDQKLQNLIRTYTPVFRGNPFESLILKPEVCFGFITWMIKKPNPMVFMDEGVTHGEDRLYFTRLAQDPATLYTFVDEVIYETRVHGSSAMTNLYGLENGYIHLYRTLKNDLKVKTWFLIRFKLRQARVLFLSNLSAGNFRQALTSALRMIIT